MNKPWAFNDLHGFKDFVVFVQLCVPNNFPVYEDEPPEYRWTFEKAFHDLRLGLDMAVEEKGAKPVFEQCKHLVDKAYQHYEAGEEDEGWYTWEEVHKLLKKVRTQ